MVGARKWHCCIFFWYTQMCTNWFDTSIKLVISCELLILLPLTTTSNRFHNHSITMQTIYFENMMIIWYKLITIRWKNNSVCVRIRTHLCVHYSDWYSWTYIKSILKKCFLAHYVKSKGKWSLLHIGRDQNGTRTK